MSCHPIRLSHSMTWCHFWELILLNSKTRNWNGYNTSRNDDLEWCLSAGTPVTTSDWGKTKQRTLSKMSSYVCIPILHYDRRSIEKVLNEVQYILPQSVISNTQSQDFELWFQMSLQGPVTRQLWFKCTSDKESGWKQISVVNANSTMWFSLHFANC